MIVNNDAVQVRVEPLKLRLTLSKKLPPAAMGMIIDKVIHTIHRMIETEVPVYDELPVQPANAWAIEVGFGAEPPRPAEVPDDLKKLFTPLPTSSSGEKT